METSNENEHLSFSKDLVNKILNLIKTTRKAKKITQGTLAELLGVTQNTYKEIENGRINLSIERLFVILKYLDISEPFGFNKNNDVLDFLQAFENHKQSLLELKDILQQDINLINILTEGSSSNKEKNLNNRVLQINLKANQKEKKEIQVYQDFVNQNKDNKVGLLDILLDFIRSKNV